MTKNEGRVAFITMRDPRDQGAWSGTQYRIYQSLIKQFDTVDSLGPVKLNVAERGIIKAFEKFCGVVFGKYNRIHSLLRGYLHARHFSRKLRSNDYTLIFASACSPVVAFLKTDLPIVYLSDTTFSLVLDYYEEFSGLCRFSVFEGQYAERTAITRSSAVIVSSEWARQSVIKDYGASASQVQICLFGANIDVAPKVDEATEKLAHVGRQCNLLFLARDWRRKGGSVALNTFHQLKRNGFNVTLTICGCEPDQYEPTSGLTIIPFLDKNLDNDVRRYHTLMAQSHFLILPTTADCTPMVFAEANAYSMPVITADTGGISSVVKNDINGYLLPVDADSAAYAALIKEKYFSNEEQYISLSKSSRKEYERMLNWDTWGKCARAFIDSRLVAMDSNDLSLQR